MKEKRFSILFVTFLILLNPSVLFSQSKWNPLYPFNEIGESYFYTSPTSPGRTSITSSEPRLNLMQKEYQFKRPKRLKELEHYFQKENNASDVFKRKNAVWVGIMTINYGRIIPIDKITALSISAGGSFIDQNIIPFTQIETTLLLGNGKHFFEPGGFFFTDYNEAFLLLRLGYRYQHANGLLIRLAPLILFGDDLAALPSVCIGYTF